MNIGNAVKIIKKEYPSVTISRIRFLEKEGLINPNRSKGGTRSQDWVSGSLASKFDFFLKKLKKDDIVIDYVFWHQGESEIKDANRIYYQNYINNMHLIFQKFLTTSKKTKIGKFFLVPGRFLASKHRTELKL